MTVIAPLRLVVVGLGRMGMPIAAHLARAGHSVVGHDRDERRTALAGAEGVAAASALLDQAREADILVTVLPGAAAFEEAMVGSGGLLDALPAGGCWLDLTSNDPRVAQRVADASQRRGVRAVGAPMGGGVEAAAGAALEFYVGGSPEDRARAAPVLEVLAAPGGVRVAGDTVGAGYSAKLLINLLWFGQVAAVTETLLLGQELGIRPDHLRRLIAGSAGDSAFAQRHLDPMLAGDDLTTFGLADCVDELDVLEGLADDHGTPFALSRLVAQLHREALELFGPVEGEVMVARMLEARAGRTVRAPRAG